MARSGFKVIFIVPYNCRHKLNFCSVCHILINASEIIVDTMMCIKVAKKVIGFSDYRRCRIMVELIQTVIVEASIIIKIVKLWNLCLVLVLLILIIHFRLNCRILATAGARSFHLYLKFLLLVKLLLITILSNKAGDH